MSTTTSREWVKASERTPIWERVLLNHLNSRKTYVCVKANGLYFSAFFNHDTNEFQVQDQPEKVYWGANVFDKFKIEWLEEKEVPVTTDVEGFEELIEMLGEWYEDCKNKIYAGDSNAVNPLMEIRDMCATYLQKASDKFVPQSIIQKLQESITDKNGEIMDFKLKLEGIHTELSEDQAQELARNVYPDDMLSEPAFTSDAEVNALRHGYKTALMARSIELPQTDDKLKELIERVKKMKPLIPRKVITELVTELLNKPTTS